jgi:hypothetical protein
VLAGLARFQGTAEAFWPVYLRAIGEALPARRVLLLTSAVGRPWQARAQWASGAADHDDDAQWTLDLVGRASPALPLVLRNEHDELALAMLPGRSAEGTGPVAAVVALAVDAGVWDEPSLQTWATLVASIPSVWLASTAGEPAAVPSASPDDDRGAAGQVGSAGPVPDEVLRRAERVHEVLQTSLRLQQQDRFMALAMAVCNEIALQYRCERVSLGWVKGHYVRLSAVSHVENFDPRAGATRALEAAMEEAMDQACVLAVPPQADGGQAVQAHQAYAEAVGLRGAVVSVPLADGQSVHAVLTLERQAGALQPEEQWELQLLMQSVSRWMRHLQHHDRWWGARLRDAVAQHWAGLLRPRHTAAKLGVAAAAASVVLLLLLPLALPCRCDPGDPQPGPPVHARPLRRLPEPCECAGW